MLQEKLEEPISEPPSPRQFADGEDAVGDLASHITSLREEIRRLKQQLAKSEADCKSQLAPYNVRIISLINGSLTFKAELMLCNAIFHAHQTRFQQS